MKHFYLCLIALFICSSIRAQDNNCEAVEVLWANQLNYNLSTSIGVQLSDIEDGLSLSITGDNGYQNTISVENSFTSFDHLLSSVKYSIYLINECESVKIFPQENLINEESLLVSDEMFSALSNYVNFNEATDFFYYMKDLEEVSEFERKYVLQEYLFDGVLPDDYQNGIPSETNPDPGEGCKCRLIMNATTFIAPTKSSIGGVVEPKIIDEGDCWDCSGVRDYWDYNAELSGPAKYERLYSRAKHLSGKEVSSQYISDEGGEGHARLRYHNFCLGYDRTPESCECEKQIQLQYIYNTKIFNKAKTINVLGDEGAASLVEDIAAVIISPHNNTSDIEVLSAGQVSSDISCSSRVNLQWFFNLQDIIFDIGELILESEGSEDPRDIFDLAVELKDKVQDAVGTPIRFNDKCKSHLKTQSLINGTAQLKIQVNEPVDVFLYSQSRMTQSGYGGWQCESEISSDFSLVGVIKEGFGWPVSFDCCTPFITNWVTADAPESHYTLNNHYQYINSYVNLFREFPIEVSQNYGVVSERATGVCDEEDDVEDSSGSQEVLHFESGDKLIDLQGRQYDLDDNHLDLKLKSGIYILHNGSKSKKIFIP